MTRKERQSAYIIVGEEVRIDPKGLRPLILRHIQGFKRLVLNLARRLRHSV